MFARSRSRAFSARSVSTVRIIRIHSGTVSSAIPPSVTTTARTAEPISAIETSRSRITARPRNTSAPPPPRRNSAKRSDSSPDKTEVEPDSDSSAASPAESSACHTTAAPAATTTNGIATMNSADTSIDPANSEATIPAKINQCPVRRSESSSSFESCGGSGREGRNIHRPAYKSPPKKPSIASTTNATRTWVGDRRRYSAIPAVTPPRIPRRGLR